MRFDDAVFRLFLVLSCVQLAGEATGAREVAAAAKPWLLPLLAWAWRRSVPWAPAELARGVMVFYGASWVGDIALLLAPEGPTDTAILGVPKHELWFLVGVMAFAVAHVAIIGVMRRVDRPQVPFAGRWWWFLPPVCWGLAVAAWVVPAVWADPVRWPAAGALVAYGALLLAMVGFAIRRAGRVSPRSFWLVVAGAAVFLLSDTLIGVVHLVKRGVVPLGGLAILSTYLLAEVWIGHGVAVQAGQRDRTR